MNRTTYLILIIICLIFLNAYVTKSGFWDGRSTTYSNLTREPYVPPKKINNTLIITYNDKESVKFEAESDAGDSIFNLLRTAAAKENINIVTDKDGKVMSINNVKDSASLPWSYYVNNQVQTADPNENILKDKDEIEWKIN